VLRPFGSLGLANVVAAVASFLSLAVVARALSVDEFAQLVFARSVTAAAFAFLDPRLEDSLQRFVPIVQRDQGSRAAERLFERMVMVDQGVNAAFCALGLTLVLTGAVPNAGIADPALLVPAIVLVAAQGPVGTLSAGYALTEGLARWGVLQSAAVIVVTTASLIGLAAGGAVGFLAGGAAAALVITAALWFATVRRTRRAYGAPFTDRQSFPRGFLAFTLRAAANSSVLIGAEALPLTIVGLSGSAATLASFRVALSPGRLANALVSPVASIVYPRASKASAEERAAVAAREALQFTRRAAPLAAVVFCVGAVAMPAAITIAFGRSYRGASTTAILLLAAALLRGVVAWSKTLPLALGHPSRRLVVSVIDVTGLVVAAALLADTSHALGVGIAYVCIAVGVSAYWLHYARRQAAKATRSRDESPIVDART
jgi:O-antigen/teichoic acid export membrane protein